MWAMSIQPGFIKWCLHPASWASHQRLAEALRMRLLFASLCMLLGMTWLLGRTGGWRFEDVHCYCYIVFPVSSTPADSWICEFQCHRHHQPSSSSSLVLLLICVDYYNHHYTTIIIIITMIHVHVSPSNCRGTTGSFRFTCPRSGALFHHHGLCTSKPATRLDKTSSWAVGFCQKGDGNIEDIWTVSYWGNDGGWLVTWWLLTYISYILLISLIYWGLAITHLMLERSWNAFSPITISWHGRRVCLAKVLATVLPAVEDGLCVGEESQTTFKHGCFWWDIHGDISGNIGMYPLVNYQ